MRDSAAVFDAIMGPMAGDPYAAPPLDRPLLDEVGADPGALRVAMYNDAMLSTNVHPHVRAAIDDAAKLLADLGHQVDEATIPDLANTRFGWRTCCR